MADNAPVNDAAQKAKEELAALLRRAEKGDQTTLPALRKLLEAPSMVDALGGDLARQAQLTLVHKFSEQNLMFREALLRKMDLLRAELAGSNPPALERLLVERVVTCWLHLHHLEHLYAQRDSMGMELATYYQRSMTSAQKRYLAAIKTLALVRKLAVPVLQVNIAKKQVNVGQAQVNTSPQAVEQKP